MSWDRQLRIVVSAAAIAVLAACSGGMSGVAPQVSGGTSNDTVPAPPKELQVTQAPTATIKQVDAAKGRDDLNLGQWQYEVPLAVTPGYSLTSLPFLNTCENSPSPLLGIWYLTLKSITVAQQPVTIPACKFTSKAVSTANFYIVQVDVSLSGVVVTPLSQPVVVSGKTWTFYANAKGYTFAADNIYAFWVGNYTGTGTPTSSPL
ncbi:MAG: hypothetical protein WA629_04975 [Candidatus Aquilonibacter sp.]